MPELRCNDKSTVTLLASDQSPDQIRPIALICPGGGYEGIATGPEGLEYAQRLEKAGYRAFVLTYRTAPNRYPEPQKDLALAIKHIRRNAKKYRVDPNDLMLLGSSAGGHLCGSLIINNQSIEKQLMDDLKMECPNLFEEYAGISCLPEKLCLCYPVVSCIDHVHEPSFQALTGGREELRLPLSIERHVRADFPKTFVWACEDDELVPPVNARSLAEALEKAGVNYAYRSYPQGGHGCGIGTGTSAEGWMDEMLEFMK